MIYCSHEVERSFDPVSGVGSVTGFGNGKILRSERGFSFKQFTASMLITDRAVKIDQKCSKGGSEVIY